MDPTAMVSATESLNQTLKRFQSMIKQVEERFAERERVAGSVHTQEAYRGEASAEHQRSSMSSPKLKPDSNEYDFIKQSIEQRVELLNS